MSLKKNFFLDPILPLAEAITVLQVTGNEAFRELSLEP